jgi:hypothetical protein
MEYRDVMTEYTGFPLEEIVLSTKPNPDADTLLIKASDGYAFLISFDELITNDNILLVQSGRGENAAFDVVGPQSSKAWVRNVSRITVITSESLEIVDITGKSHNFNPDEWVSEMDSTQVNLPEGSQKLQGVPVWKILSQYIDEKESTEVVFSGDSDQLTIPRAEIYNNDNLRVFTVIKSDGIGFALATMSGELRLFPLRSIEVQ